MFASFYPFSKEQSGLGRVEASLDYVYGGKTSAGSDRLVAPKTICGMDGNVLRVLGHDLGLVGNNPATIGSINVEERLSIPLATEIASSFFDFSFAGIDPSQRAFLAIGHEKRLKLSGLVSTDIHFVILNTLLGSGSVFVPYYPKADYFGFKVWAEQLNYLHGLSSKWDPAKRRITVPRVYGYDSAEVVTYKRDIGALMSHAYREGRLQTPNDVFEILKAAPGVISVNRRGKGITVETTDLARPIQLHAAVYDPDFRLESLRQEIARQQRMTEEQCKKAYEEILSARMDRHHQRYGRSGPRWAIKPKNHSIEQHKDLHELPFFYSQSGQLWRRAIELDEKYGSALHRLGITCDDLGRRIQQIGAVLGDCLEETEPVGLRCGSDQSILADLAAGSEAIRGAVDHAHRALTGPRPASNQGGGVPRELQEFNGAVYLLGQHFAGLPGSVAEARLALERARQNRRQSAEQDQWLQSCDMVAIRQGALAWLRWIQPDDCEDLDVDLGLRSQDPERSIPRESSLD